MYESQVIFAKLLTMWPGILIGGLVIAAAHIGFWDAKLKRSTAYVVGSTCVLIGEAVSTALIGDIFPILFHFVHLAFCGLVILFAWRIRGEEAARKIADQDAREIVEEATKRERTAP